MRNDNRLSRVLHLLIHLDRHEGAATSELLATMLATNPVVVRRMMAGLREAGLVASERGHGGGWMLARGLDGITLLDVHQALGSPSAFAIGIAQDDPRCLVEQAVNARLAETLREAESLLLARFEAISLADLAADFDRRLEAIPPRHRPAAWPHR